MGKRKDTWLTDVELTRLAGEARRMIKAGEVSPAHGLALVVWPPEAVVNAILARRRMLAA